MADRNRGRVLNSRTFWVWTDPKTGKPASGDNPPAGDTGLFGTGLGGKAPPPAVQYHEVLYENGDKVTSHFNPDKAEWSQDSVEKEPGFESEHRADQPKPAAPKTEDEKRKEKADADRAEAEARRSAVEARTAENPPPPERITRTVEGTYQHPEHGTEPYKRTEQVSKAQADYDRQLALDAANAAADAARAERERLTNAIAQGQLNRQQAADAYQKEYDKIKLALDARLQEITIRGQDINAGVQQRQQNMQYEEGLARAGTTLAGQLLAGFVPASQLRQGQAIAERGRTGDYSRPLPEAYAEPAPFGPDLPIRLAQQARQTAPAPYQLPGAPPGAYRLPTPGG